MQCVDQKPPRLHRHRGRAVLDVARHVIGHATSQRVVRVIEQMVLPSGPKQRPPVASAGRARQCGL
jgi:hypothetical protein